MPPMPRPTLPSLITAAIAALACGGVPVPVEPPVVPPPAAPILPLGWREPVDRATVQLRARPGLACSGGGNEWHFDPGDRFVVQTRNGRSGGEWQEIGNDLGWISHETRLEETACTAARWLSLDPGGVILCAEGPLACGVPVDWAIEIVDLGAGDAETERAALQIGNLTGQGPGVVFWSDGDPREGRRVRYRSDGSRRLAAVVGGALGLPVDQDPEAWSPVVVELGRASPP